MTIRAELSSDTIATSCGIEIKAPSPVLALCRELLQPRHTVGGLSQRCALLDRPLYRGGRRTPCQRRWNGIYDAAGADISPAQASNSTEQHGGIGKPVNRIHGPVGLICGAAIDLPS